MLYIDNKYAKILGTRLRNFKEKKDNTWNFSCPVCGDSSKNKLKARGYIYPREQDLLVKCHNCGYGSNIGNLIKYVDPMLYDEYVLERYKAGASKYTDHKDVKKTSVIIETPTVELLEDDILSGLSRIDKLPLTHPAVQYLVKRKIPKDKWHLLYFAPKFKAFTNSVTAKFQEPIKDEHPSMIIPFFKISGGYADTNSLIVSGTGSVVVRKIVQATSRELLGTSIINVVQENGQLKLVCNQQLDRSGFANYTGDDSVYISYRIHYGRFR